MATPLSRRTFLFAGASFATYGFAQESAKDATFTSDVNVVNVFATVHDKQGKVIRSLSKEDFLLEDEGHARPIQYFAQQSDLPLTLGLLIDTSGSQRNVLEPERHASFRFLEQVMRPEKDRAFVIHFDYEVELLQDMTSSRKDLEAALEDLTVNKPQLNRRSQGGQGGGGGTGGGGGYPGGGGGGRGGRGGGGTDLYDAVLLASDDMMKKQQGRKAVFVLSDGVDTGSKGDAHRCNRIGAAFRHAGLRDSLHRPGIQGRLPARGAKRRRWRHRYGAARRDGSRRWTGRGRRAGKPARWKESPAALGGGDRRRLLRGDDQTHAG